MTNATLFLSSLDSSRFEPVRQCTIVRPLQIGEHNRGLLVHVDPSVVGQDLGSGADLTEFVLTPRFHGTDIRKIDQYPFFVYVTIANPDWSSASSSVEPSDLTIVAWAELYRTADHAAAHRFD